MMKKIYMIVMLALCTPLSFGHDDATLDQMPSPNQGQIRMAGAYHVELVLAKTSPTAQKNVVDVYITDHAGNKIASAGVTGTATILTGKTKTTVDLRPVTDNKLSGVGVYAYQPHTKAIVSLKFANQSTVQARFATAVKHQH